MLTIKGLKSNIMQIHFLIFPTFIIYGFIQLKIFLLTTKKFRSEIQWVNWFIYSFITQKKEIEGLSARKDVDDSNSGAVVLKLDNVEDDVPTVACYKLTAIAAPLMNHLKAMMQVIQDQQNEIKTIKQQLHQYKVLLHNFNIIWN